MSANAAASAAARPAEALPTRPFAPKHAHGAPARPARIAATWTPAAAAISSAPAVSGDGRAGADGDPERELDRDQRAQTAHAARGSRIP